MRDEEGNVVDIIIDEPEESSAAPVEPESSTNPQPSAVIQGEPRLASSNSASSIHGGLAPTEFFDIPAFEFPKRSHRSPRRDRLHLPPCPKARLHLRNRLAEGSGDELRGGLLRHGEG